MEFKFKKPTEIDAKDIATWKYEGEYSFYDNDKTEAKQEWALNIHKEDSAFVIHNEKDELVGNCSFNAEDDEFILGVQMRPNLTGKGTGTQFVKAILDFGRNTYKFNEIQLFVAKFNERAIKIYEKLGFKKTEEFIWNVNGEEKEFIAMVKKY
ncbi:MAG TPA: GNAT family N-acetyltransferase [Clostridium sp.]|nr:GNAT family N-acetyltransferase [Clostridium sp.]